MKLVRTILGQIVTEKSERMKAGAKRIYTLKVSPDATKVDIKKACKTLYDVDVAEVKVMRVPQKTRAVGRGRTMEKRHVTKKALVTLTPDSKPLDLAA